MVKTVGYAVRFRVWRFWNGIPVSLGTIDINASEDELIRTFLEAMPRPGEGAFMFKMRPIDVHGREIGREVNLRIPDDHPTLLLTRFVEGDLVRDGMGRVGIVKKVRPGCKIILIESDGAELEAEATKLTKISALEAMGG